MSGLEQQIFHWLSEFAYHPTELYLAIVALMIASSFGLPIPEEVALISSGLIAYAATRPDLFPPPSPEAVPVNTYTLAAVCFFAVFLSDLLVFAIGRHFGKKVGQFKFMARFTSQPHQEKLKVLREKYGVWACGIFRFTPGIRFPGHLSCGAMGIPYWKFIAIDGTAALLTVPTQVILVAQFGETVLNSLKQFKIIFLSGLAAAILLFIVYRFWKSRKQARNLSESKAPTEESTRNEAAS